ncbi:hypothetical protein GQ607_005125 [Colletotrichum asianum]|uniref:Uncharacterized protein n=1 Tax=Colletotrichum asianum TaxID=702518 RepID=A0A8H3ZUY3_9PEZI|nr:hypothetical protein GQ607_005125 [Colletotrichum asianum]
METEGLTNRFGHDLHCIFIHWEIIKGHRITESIRNNFGSVSQHFAPREACCLAPGNKPSRQAPIVTMT